MHRFVIILLFSLSSVAYAASPQSWDGGTGIGYMRTAGVMHEDESSWYLNMGMDQMASLVTPDVTASLSQARLGYITSIGGHTELGMDIPYAIYSPDATSVNLNAGTREIRGVLKHSLTYQEKKEGFGAAISLLSTLHTGNPASGVTSGQFHFGTELNLSHWSQETAIHLNIGTEDVDVWDESAVPVFVTDQLTKIGLGIEIGLSQALGLTIELLSNQSGLTQQQGVMLGAVFQYFPNKNWAYTFGAGTGMPAGTNIPTSNVILGITYSANGHHRSRYYGAADYVDYYKMNRELQRQVEDLTKKITVMEQRLEQNEIRIEDTEKGLNVYKYDHTKDYAD